MLTLGLSYGFHDSSAALARDGVLLASLAEERLTRQKHDANFPTNAIDGVLRTAGASLDDVDAIYYHEDPNVTFTRVIAATLAGFPDSRREFVAAMKSWFGKKLWTKQEIANRLALPLEMIHTLHHHESHAYQAFLGSGFDRAAVLTIDAVGEWATTTINHMQHQEDGTPDLQILAKSEFPNSLGLFYSAMTAYLGFRPMEGECSTMALAAFGRPRFAKALRELVWTSDDGKVFLDQNYFEFVEFYKRPFKDKLLDLLGPQRAEKAKLPFASYTLANASTSIDAEAQRFADIAASTQLVYEEAVLHLARMSLAWTGAKHLCLAGGGALNCVANARLIKELPIEGFYVPPDPGDGGAAVGAALFGSLGNGATKRSSRPSVGYTPYCGSHSTAEERLDFIAELDPIHSERNRKLGNQKRLAYRYATTEIMDPDTLCEHVATALADGKIVGWVHGASESGPRALGARSLLIRPDLGELAQRLSREVKDRAAFRPYALAIAEEAATEILQDFDPRLWPQRWMQTVLPVAFSYRSRLAPALHVDGTTRPQVVGKSDHPTFHKLLLAVGQKTGVPALINTSFNESGYPIVHGPLDALVMFTRTAIDLLVIDHLVISKEPKS